MDGTRSALIVASDDYTDPGLRRLRAPASDAQALAGVLRDPQIGGFQVRTLLNEPAHEVNLAVEEFFADRRPDDLLLLHFSCHGLKDEGGELYFAAANTRLRRLGATAVAAEFVNRRMNRSRSRRVVLLLDCCYAGAFERGMTARAGTGMAIEEQFGGRGRAVITASSAMEYAFEGDELADTNEQAPSVFTSALVEGLESGEADRDQDGMVGLDELYDYVYDRVRTATPNQTPGKWTFGVQGDLYIARRAHPVTTPAPLPPELQEAIDSPFAGVRAGAVPELARLLGSRHAGLALAAKLTMEQLTGDDSRMVSAATQALAAQAPAPPQPLQPEPPPLPPEPAPPPPLPPEPAPPQPLPPEPAPPQPLPPEPAPRPEAEVVPPAPTPSATADPIAPPAPVATAEPVPPATRSSAPSATPPPATAAPAASVAMAPDGRFRIAGQLAIVGTVLQVVSLFPDYQWDDPMAVRLPGVQWYVLIFAAITAAAGVCLLLPSTKRLVGPGLLLGIVAASTVGFLGSLAAPLVNDGYESAWRIAFVADLVLVAAACLAGLALARGAEVHVVRRLPEQPLPWLVVVLGLAAIVELLVLIQQLRADGWGWYLAQFIWAAAMALVVPALGATAVPRQFGASLLAAWAGGGVATSVFYTVFLDSQSGDGSAKPGSSLFVVFGVTMLALLVVAVLLGRTAPAAEAEQAPAPGR